LLEVQKQQIKEDWQGIKEDLRPSLLIVSSIRNLFTRKASTAAATLGINLLTDGFLKKILLAKTGWITRWVVPFLVKNYASHLAGKPEQLLEKVKSFFKKKEDKVHDNGIDAV